MNPAEQSAPPTAADTPRVLQRAYDKSDRIFRRITVGAAASSLVVMALIALFLVMQARPAVSKAGLGFFTRFEWAPDGVPAIYGIASHGKWRGAFKPGNRSPDIKGLYFAGGAAHPGPGMPMVLMSGWIAADALDREIGRAHV